MLINILAAIILFYSVVVILIFGTAYLLNKEREYALIISAGGGLALSSFVFAYPSSYCAGDAIKYMMYLLSFISIITTLYVGIDVKKKGNKK